MRTTLDLNEALIVRAKAEAARQRTTLTRLIEEGLALRLDHPTAEARPREPFRLRVFHGGTYLRPDIDPTKTSELLAAVDEEYDRRQAGLLPFRDPDEET